ncbi:uncharacterized protein [Salvelinus alpinus]|uniref:uncharacterized protein isoform X7 n=1 Tax=Salvelinus alpinus TaxID=8036 RepID=UPI0039FCB004
MDSKRIRLYLGLDNLVVDCMLQKKPGISAIQYRNQLKLYTSSGFLPTMVTQRFFETVYTQLECWYESKIQDAKRQAELRAQQDRAELLQRIRSLEEELEQLRMTNGSTDS